MPFLITCWAAVSSRYNTEWVFSLHWSPAAAPGDGAPPPPAGHLGPTRARAEGGTGGGAGGYAAPEAGSQEPEAGGAWRRRAAWTRCWSSCRRGATRGRSAPTAGSRWGRAGAGGSCHVSGGDGWGWGWGELDALRPSCLPCPDLEVSSPDLARMCGDEVVQDGLKVPLGRKYVHSCAEGAEDGRPSVCLSLWVLAPRVIPVSVRACVCGKEVLFLGGGPAAACPELGSNPRCSLLWFPRSSTRSPCL